jgi:ankyrin repeat protein
MPDPVIDAFDNALRSEDFDRAMQILRDHPELRALSAPPFGEPWVVAFALFGPLSALKFLLDHEFPHDVTDAIGRTPLQLAVDSGTAQHVKLLLEHGADPTVRDPILGSLLLENAVGTGDSAIVRMLLEAGSPMYGSMNTILDSLPDNLAAMEPVWTCCWNTGSM